MAHHANRSACVAKRSSQFGSSLTEGACDIWFNPGIAHNYSCWLEPISTPTQRLCCTIDAMASALVYRLARLHGPFGSPIRCLLALDAADDSMAMQPLPSSPR